MQSTITTGQTAPSQNYYSGPDVRAESVSEALEVLRGTHDGDDLDRADLALLQAVVNHGPTALTETGRDRWDLVVREVREGRYVKPWLHEVEHLTRDHEGYIYWKGARIEHYSFRDRKREAAAAQKLGAHCRRLEAAGRPVTAGELNKAWDEISYGHGLDLRRVAVTWLLEAGGARLNAVELRQNDAHEAAKEIAESVNDCVARWASSREAVRSFTVVTTGDYDSLVRCLTQECEIRRNYWRAYDDSQRLGDLLDRLSKAVSRNELATPEEVLESMLGPYISNSAASAAAENHFERERG